MADFAVMTALTHDQATQLFRTAPARHLDVGAGEVAYRRVGTGPDVLFVHGWPVSGATWRELLPYLAPHVTCHVIDLVGAGHSRFDRTTPITVEQHIRTVTAVIDALKLEDVSVVGHDSGGLIARHAMAGDPRLRSMALVDTEQPQGLTWPFRQFLWASRLPGFERLLAWAVMKPGLRRSRWVLGECFTDRSRLDGVFEELFLAPLRDDPDRRWAAGRLIDSFDTGLVYALSEAHAKIDVPVRLVWGEEDPFFPVERAREMVSTFTDASLVVVPDAKLFVHEERPREVAEAMLPVLLVQRPQRATAASTTGA